MGIGDWGIRYIPNPQSPLNNNYEINKNIKLIFISQFE